MTQRVSHPPSQAMPLLARFRTRAPPPTRLHNPSARHSQKQDRIAVWCLRAHLQLWPGACRWVVVCLSCRHPFCKGTTKGCCSLRDLHSFWLAISWKTSNYFFCNTYSMAGLTFMTCSERQRNQRSASQTTVKILDEKVLSKKKHAAYYTLIS